MRLPRKSEEAAEAIAKEVAHMGAVAERAAEQDRKNEKTAKQYEAYLALRGARKHERVLHKAITEIIRRKMYAEWNGVTLSAISDAIKETNPTAVARALNVSRQTVYGWMREMESVEMPAPEVQDLADWWEELIDKELPTLEQDVRGREA